jgi:hypothetical protein
MKDPVGSNTPDSLRESFRVFESDLVQAYLRAYLVNSPRAVKRTNQQMNLLAVQQEAAGQASPDEPCRSSDNDALHTSLK